jgi:hypothetical protein
MYADGWTAQANVAAQIIRQASGEGRFATPDEILEELVGLELLPPDRTDPGSAVSEIVAAALARNLDLANAGVEGEPRYYSTQFMTAAFAGLLLRKERDALQLIAETVRENSSLYPRPLPVAAFERAPFALTRQEILGCLHQMAGQEAYRDIARTCTSAGSEFLYSTAHLEADYATALAEWIDVGQYENP